MKLQEFISVFYNNSINNELTHEHYEAMYYNTEQYEDMCDDYGSCERDKCTTVEQFIELIKPLLHEDVECITENIIESYLIDVYVNGKFIFRAETLNDMNELYMAIKNGEDLSRFDF